MQSKRQPDVNKVTVLPLKPTLTHCKPTQTKNAPAPTFGGAFGARKGH